MKGRTIIDHWGWGLIISTSPTCLLHGTWTHTEQRTGWECSARARKYENEWMSLDKLPFLLIVVGSLVSELQATKCYVCGQREWGRATCMRHLYCIKVLYDCFLLLEGWICIHNHTRTYENTAQTSTDRYSMQSFFSGSIYHKLFKGQMCWMLSMCLFRWKRGLNSHIHIISILQVQSNRLCLGVEEVIVVIARWGFMLCFHADVGSETSPV